MGQFGLIAPKKLSEGPPTTGLARQSALLSLWFYMTENSCGQLEFRIKYTVQVTVATTMRFGKTYRGFALGMTKG
jgi:hypothetical protein